MNENEMLEAVKYYKQEHCDCSTISDCTKCAKRIIEEHDAKVRADAIDEFVERITLPLTEEDIERIAKELKEQKNDR